MFAAPRFTAALIVAVWLALIALAVPDPLLMSVKALPSLPIVTGVVSLKVRLFTVMPAPGQRCSPGVAPVAEKITLVAAPGTTPVLP